LPSQAAAAASDAELLAPLLPKVRTLSPELSPMKISSRLSFGSALFTTTIALGAHAQSLTEDTRARGPAENFGAKGQLAISSDAAFAIEHRSISGASEGTTSISLAPAADYFIMNNLSVGGFVRFGYSKSGDSDSNHFALGPRVGYNLPFSDLISIWPKAGFSYARTSVTDSTSTPGGGTVSVTTTANAFALNLYAPVMIHPVQHFFAGFGPFLDADLSGDARTTAFGGRLTIGGWM
jgi:hypothetical protein